MEKDEKSSGSKPIESATSNQSDSHPVEDIGSSNELHKSDSNLTQDSENNYAPPRPIMVSTGINTTPRHPKPDEARIAIPTESSISLSASVRDPKESDSDSIVSDRSSRASVINSILSFSTSAKEGCAEGVCIYPHPSRIEVIFASFAVSVSPSCS